MLDKEFRKAIDEVCKEQIRQVEKYFEVLEKTQCLNRIGKREQFTMKIMPLAFRERLLKKLGVSDDSFKKIIPA